MSRYLYVLLHILRIHFQILLPNSYLRINSKVKIIHVEDVRSFNYLVRKVIKKWACIVNIVFSFLFSCYIWHTIIWRSIKLIAKHHKQTSFNEIFKDILQHTLMKGDVMITFHSGKRFVLAEKIPMCIGIIMIHNYYLHS